MLPEVLQLSGTYKKRPNLENYASQGSVRVSFGMR